MKTVKINNKPVKMIEVKIANKQSDMDEICKGCLTHERYLNDPASWNECNGYKKMDIDCPCASCIVKVMCIVTCDNLHIRDWDRG